jgi:hypothetical protein
MQYERISPAEIAGESRQRHPRVRMLRTALWIFLVLLWVAYGISVSSALLLNSLSDPRKFYNYITGHVTDPTVPVVEANSMHMSHISIAALAIVAIAFVVLRPWRRAKARQLWPSWYAGLGLLAAIPLGLALSLVTPIEYVRDYAVYLKLAQTLYSTGDYSDFSEGNFVDPADTLAWRPPGTSLLYGLPIWTGVPAQLSVWIINALIALIVLFFVRSSLEARQARAPIGTVVIAGIVVCFTTLPFMLLPISHFPVIASLAVLLLLVPTESRHLSRLSLFRWLLAGFLIGASALFRPNFILEAAILAGAILVAGRSFGGLRNGHQRSAAAILVCALGVAIVLGPWTVRNWFTLHRFVPISTNGGMVFYSANGSAKSNEQGHYISRLAVQLYNDVPDEVDRDHEGWKRGLKNIAGHPLSFAESFLYRVPRLLANPLNSVNYIREQARDRSWIWTLYIAETATLIAFWWLWFLMYIHRKSIRSGVFSAERLPWPQVSLLVVVFVSLLFENSPTFQLSFLPFILFIWFEASGSSQINDGSHESEVIAARSQLKTSGRP